MRAWLFLVMIATLGSPAWAQTLGFARIEARTTWQEQQDTRWEKRAYYSGLIKLSPNDRKSKARLMSYFNEGVVQPMGKRSIKLEYTDADITIFPVGYTYKDAKQGNEDLAGHQRVDQRNGTAIYSFVWNPASTTANEKTAQPKRVWAAKPGPAGESAPFAIMDKSGAQTTTGPSQSKEQIWAYCAIDVRGKDKKGQPFLRQYVSEIVPISRKDYDAYYTVAESEIKKTIWKYFASTVVEGAKARGEVIEQPYDSSIEYGCNVDSYGGSWRYREKSLLAQPRQTIMDFAKQTNKALYIFRWDPSGANAAKDLAREKARKGAALPK